MNAYNFNSRSSYIIARMDWRTDYQAVSQAARVARQNFIDAERAYSADRSAAHSSAVAKARAERAKVRTEANRLLAARSAMKIEAARQWAAANVTAVTQTHVTV